MDNKRKSYIRWVLLIGWMSLIFYMSNQPGEVSSEQSRFVVMIFDQLGLNLNSNLGDMATFLVRKVAHFSEYFILFILAYRVARLYLDKKSAKIYMIIFVFAYACSDEFHQAFVPDRGPAFKDVLIDTSGGITAAIATFIIEIINNKKRKLI